MRRAYAILVLAGLFQLALPAPAQAWWEIIEALSGPGRFYGFSIDARLLCIVDGAKGGTVVKAPSALGAITTSCKIDAGERRRMAVDFGARFMRADNNPRFANGQRISLTTLEPSISLRLIKSDRWDFVDYGFGAGVYWFSSTEFPSFNGVFLDPLRFEFHASSEMRKNAWAAVIPRVRVGYLVFPAGFDPAAFAATVPTRISRDRSLNVGVFLDLEPVLKYLTP